MTRPLQWYDSPWLNAYFAARKILDHVAPAKRKIFDDAMRVFHTDPNFKVRRVSDLFDENTVARIRKIVREIPITAMETHEVKNFGRLVVHDHPYFSELQSKLVRLVSELAGEAVEPRYNFLSLYTRMGICEPHLDAPLAKWTLDYCIDQNDPWPIHFSQIVPWPEEPLYFEGDWKETIKSAKHLRFEPKVLMPNNAILFSGSSQWHYRNAMPVTSSSGHCDLLFFHFIPKGTSELVQPAEWARLFGVPELTEIAPLGVIS